MLTLSDRPTEPPIQGLDGHLVLCTIVSNRAGEKPVDSLTSEMDVVRNWEGGARGGEEPGI